MKEFSTLQETIDYIKKRHKEAFGVRSSGIYGNIMLRVSGGRRIIFQELRGIRLKDYTVLGDRDLKIDLSASRFEFKGKKKISHKNTIFLNNLILIHIYDDRAELFTEDNIDFTYMNNSHQTHMKAMEYWKNNEQDVLRARWVCQDDDIEKRLQTIGLDRSIRQVVELGRQLIMTDEDEGEI